MTTRKAKPEKNTTGSPREVPEDVREKQDPEYTQRDFDDALERTTRQLDDPSAPARESTRK
jgi:hypothetical protein